MIDTDKRYKVDEYGGIAWHVLGHVKVRDEDYEWSGIETEDESKVKAVMVGDDRVFEFEVEQLTPLEEGDYCPECGQIGCKALG